MGVYKNIYIPRTKGRSNNSQGCADHQSGGIADLAEARSIGECGVGLYYIALLRTYNI